MSAINNYRPISLTSICCKIMESIIKDHLMSYLLFNNLISKAQHGFLAKKSTLTNLMNCMNDWTNFYNNNKSVDVIFLDLAKAIDSVCHRKLIQKLRCYGIQGNLLLWIECFLKRQQRVRINNSFSDWANVESGVPQGSVLGPLLFLLYINDALDVVHNSKNVLYADDWVIYTSMDDDGGPSLQKNLDNINSWSTEWQLTIATSKCFQLHIDKKTSGAKRI